ncbi:acetamidase/formamidase family protein [Minwuia sp. IMCC3060]|uniref:acetamidase/formamidase family protein n=1 Tax=Minwuia sp. IMCC3060 TaxID=3040675 RepID=UPI00247AE0A8|nr:acetamidase/formamidase family protein [Minwuia sp. IMCC3060]
MKNDLTIPVDPETTHWGYFDPARPAVTWIEPGDNVRIETVSGGETMLPPTPMTTLPSHREVIAKVTRRMEPGHILTGPVGINGASPGDVLSVHVHEIELLSDWGWNLIRPLSGVLPEDFDSTRVLHIPIDGVARTAALPWGVTLPLNPFFGVMGVAPPDHWGVQSSIVPRAFGGNIDCKLLGSGATLHLPVFQPGGLFSCGDGHANQGDGEVCLTAIETCMAGVFSFEVLAGAASDMPGPWMPWAETADLFITFGIDVVLDAAAKQALRAMIRLITSRSNLTREDAYTLCSIAADMRVTQLVNQHKGIHVVLPKSTFDPNP